MTKSKPRIKSKTLWTNSALIALGLAILGLPELAAYVETLPQSWQVLGLVVIGALNVLLREMTEVPLSGWLSGQVEPQPPAAASKRQAKPKAKAAKK